MLRNKGLAYGLLLAIGIALPIILPTSFLRDLAVQVLLFAMLALSLDIVVSGMGQMSFGHQAFFALGAYASGMLSVKLGLSPFVGFLAACAVAAIAGLFIGFLASRATRGVYFALVSLGFSVILLVLFRYFAGFTGGMSGISDIPPPVIALPGLPDLVIRSETSYYYMLLVFLLLIIYIISRWQRSRFGRAAAMLRENETLARSIGIAPVRMYTMSFTLAAAIAGLTGALYGHYVTYITPHLFELNYMLMVLVILFVGGVGTMGGPIIGSFIYVYMQKLIPIKQELVFFMFGAILLLFVLFMPHGIYPALRTGISRLSRRLSPAYSRAVKREAGQPD